MSVIDLVYRIADFYNLPNSQVKPIKSNTLNQAAKRPPKTGFDLTKARKELDYDPLTLEKSLELIEK